MAIIHQGEGRLETFPYNQRWLGQPGRAARAPFASMLSTYLFAIGLFVFVVAVITPEIGAGRPESGVAADDPDLLLSRIGLYFFFACLAAFSALNRGILVRSKGMLLFLVGFAGIAFALSATNNSDDLGSRALFSVLTIIFFLGFRCVWEISPNHRRRIFAGVAAVIWIQLIVGYALHGTGVERWVGGLHPNHFARFAVCALFFWTMARGRLDVIPMVVSLILTIVVSSRTSLIGLLIFIAVFGLLSSREAGTNRKLAYGLYSILLLFPIELLVNGTRHLGALADQLAIFSDDRGINSGLSGRTDSYTVLLNENASDILSGMGFRYSRVVDLGLHSGVLRNFYEFGLPLATALYGVIFWVITRQTQTGMQPGRSTQRACAAYAIASLLMTFSEPDSIVIGFLASNLFLLALSCPQTGIVDTAPLSRTRRRFFARV